MSLENPQFILSRLMELHPKSIDLTLDRVKRLLNLLGNPEKTLPPIVHIAGTNGKGSVLAMLMAMLSQAGYRTHAYISPHLRNFNERILLNGHPITDRHLLEVVKECEKINDGEPITFFEITTAAAFLAFSSIKADILLLEVGLGGRLDATNVITPEVSAITSISLDHQQYLGTSLPQIAFEKAGILKPGITTIIGPQSRVSLKILEKHAQDVGAVISRAGFEWWVDSKPSGITFCNDSSTENFPNPALHGRHQIDNAGVAIASAKYLADRKYSKLSTEAICNGLVTTVWDGRLQKLNWLELNNKWEIWIDGAHNVGASEALCSQFDIWNDIPIHMIVGMLNTKDLTGFIKPLIKYTKTITAIEIPGEQASLTSSEILNILDQCGFVGRKAENFETAILEIVKDFPENGGRIIICGSLYLVGQVLNKVKIHS